MLQNLKLKLKDGFVNDLKFTSDGNYLIAAIGQEHKLGRWSIVKNVKNSTLVIKLNISNEQPAEIISTSVLNGNVNKKPRLNLNLNNKMRI